MFPEVKRAPLVGATPLFEKHCPKPIYTLFLQTTNLTINHRPNPSKKLNLTDGFVPNPARVYFIWSHPGRLILKISSVIFASRSWQSALELKPSFKCPKSLFSQYFPGSDEPLRLPHQSSTNRSGSSSATSTGEVYCHLILSNQCEEHTFTNCSRQTQWFSLDVQLILLFAVRLVHVPDKQIVQ